MNSLYSFSTSNTMDQKVLMCHDIHGIIATDIWMQATTVSGTRAPTGGIIVLRPKRCSSDVQQWVPPNRQQITGTRLSLMLVVGKVFSPSSIFPQGLIILHIVPNIQILLCLSWSFFCTCYPDPAGSTCSTCTGSQLWHTSWPAVPRTSGLTLLYPISLLVLYIMYHS